MSKKEYNQNSNRNRRADISDPPADAGKGNAARRPPGRVLTTVLWAVFTVFTVVLFFAARYLTDSWGELSADEVVYHLKSSLNGTSPDMVIDALIRYGIPAAAVLAVIMAVLYRLRRKRRRAAAFMAAVLLMDLAALFLEEMAGNVVVHGFEKDDKQHSVDVRVVCRQDSLLLRIKDDCVPFDPSERQSLVDPEDITKNIGIRMVYSMAKDISYQNILGMNVLTVQV